MLFKDHLHGTIDFRKTPYAPLIYDLLGCAEVQRLRHMRLMNFDVPHIQDLASTKRFPHSIGACYLAVKALEKSQITIDQKKKVITAALIHDVGILPFGHLLEGILKANNNGFSHERLVQKILHGTYHETNIYHNILPGGPLGLHNVLKKHDLNPEEIYNLICPDKRYGSAISADIDLDNLDNIHRMAALLGYEEAKSNLREITKKITIDKDLRLVFTAEAKKNIDTWLHMRQSIYTMIIGQPECVQYNAFLSSLLKLAVEKEVVKEDQWFITDRVFENKLEDNKNTKKLAEWLYTKPQFYLADYIWFISNEKPDIDLYQVQKLIQDKKFKKPKNAKEEFYWVDKKLISREVMVNIKNNGQETIGINSYSILVSAIYKTDYLGDPLKVNDSERIEWRMAVYKYLQEILPKWNYSVKFPENYNDNFFNSKIKNEELNLFR